MKSVVTLLFAVLIVASSLGPARALALRPSVTIDSEVVRLGDIFMDAGKKADRVVAAAPAPGRTELYTAIRLRAIAEEAGLKWTPASRYDKVSIERTGRAVPTAEILSALRRALTAAGAPRDRKIALSRRDLELYAAPDAAVPFRIVNTRFDAASGNFAAVAEVATGTTSVDRVQIAGTAYEIATVPVLAHAMQRGEVIRDSDIETVDMKLSAVPRNAVLDKRRIIGQTPRRTMHAGVPLSLGDLQAPVVVARGSLVTVLLRTDRMLITAQGKALEDGAAGETIRVLNTRSKATIEGRVTRAGQVTVSFPVASR
jgi:flagella basal body P-ring formation protein FlgA